MVHSSTYRSLPGAGNLRARKIYTALKLHHKSATCPTCSSYTKYGCTIVRGNLIEHVGDVATFTIDPAELSNLQKAGLIKIEQISRGQHRIIFTEPAPKGVPA